MKQLLPCITFLRSRLSRFIPVHHAKQKEEKSKVVISGSNRAILSKILVHLIPISTTVVVLCLNLRGLYIGEDFTGPVRAETINIILLQVAAKIHELFIGASLGTIVLHAIRYELVRGDGLPLGLIGSGLSFNTLDYFSRKEFYASVFFWYNGENSFRKARLVVLLLVSGMLATLVGPSSAVLLVPQTQIWPAGGTDYYLDGESDDFWPSDLSGNLTDLQSVCQASTSTELAVCPAGGFDSIWEHWGRATFATFNHQDVRTYAKPLSGSTFYWPVNSPASQVVPRYVLGDVRTGEQPWLNTYLVEPHAATTTLLQHVAADWWSAIAPGERVSPTEIDDRKAYSTFLHAITSVRCSGPQNLSIIDNFVFIPRIRGRFDFDTPIGFNLSVVDSDPVDYLKFQWVHLPDDFGAASIGGVFQTAWVNNQSRTVVGCSAQAGWVPARATTDAYSFWTGWYPWNISYGGRLPVYNASNVGKMNSATNGRIAFGDTWLNLLTPTTATKKQNSRLHTPTTIESIFENAGLDDRDPTTGSVISTDDWSRENISNGTRNRLLEAIISNVIVDGISRYGSHKIFQNASDPMNTDIPSYQKLPNFNAQIIKGQTALSRTAGSGESVSLRVDMQITGFSYQKSLAGSLATTVLLIHVAMAVAHIGFLVWTKQTFKSWSTISELIALSYNSPRQNGCLVNTGAGIENRSTFGKVARIKVEQREEDDSPDCVHLVFDDDHGKCEMSQALVEVGVHHSLMKRGTISTANGLNGHKTSVSTLDENLESTDASESMMLPDRVCETTYKSVKADHFYG